MTEPSRSTRTPGAPPGMPRWAKVSLIIAIVLALAFVVTLLAGVEHGPDLHRPPAGQHGP